VINRRTEALFVRIAIPAVLVMLVLLALENAEFARNQLGLYQEEIELGLEVRIATPGELEGDTAEARHLETVLRRCLALDPEDRPADTEELRSELIPALKYLSCFDTS
jgi:hypothetical protein